MKKIIGLVIFIVQPAFAQNLISNGTFDNDISGWEPEITQQLDVTWVADDGNNANGSLQISDTFNNGGVGNTPHMPVPIQAGQTYTISAAAKVIGSSEAQRATIVVSWLDENQFDIGFNDFVDSDSQAAPDVWQNVEAQLTAPQGTAFARVALGVTTSNSGSNNPSTARWDDVRFSLANNAGFSILAAHTGLWFNVDQSGHGLNVEILDQNRAVIIWYTYDNNGNQIWLLGLGTHDGQTITVDVNITQGAMFPPNFNPDDVQLTPWGQFTLEFTGCNEGIFRWMPLEGNGFTAGELAMTRLTSIQSLACEE